MINIIESAIITIVISFISGLLLEYYKNLSPRILCNIGKGIPIEKNSKKICAYVLTVRNISNKIIHEITLHVQSSQNNLEIEDAKITKGLKFDSSINENILEVDIPFLDKDDEFSVTLYIESQYGINNKPAVIIRSPEKFKEVDTEEQKGILSSFFSIPENISKAVSNKSEKDETKVSSENDDFTVVMNKVPDTKKTIDKENREITRGNKKSIRNKMAMMAVVVIILFMSVFGTIKLFSNGTTTKEQTPSVETNDNKQSTGENESADGTNKNTSSKSSTGGTNKNSGSKSSTNEGSGTMTAADEAKENTSAKSSTDGTTGNAKAPADGATKNTDTKAQTGGATGNTEVKISTDGTTKNTDTKQSTSGTTGSADAKTSTNKTTGNTAN